MLSQHLSPRLGAALLILARQRVDMRHAGKEQETAIHAAADAHLNAMTLAVMYAFLKGRKAYKSGGTEAAVEAVRRGLLRSLPPVLLKCVAAGGKAGAGMLPSKARAAMRALAPFDIRFDKSNPAAVKWALEHATELAQNLSDTSRDDIKQAIADALDGDGIDAAYDTILAAVGDTDRAEMISRSETMNAANAGTLESFSQAQEAGLLPANATKQWIANSDACDDCQELDGEEVGLDEEFISGDDAPGLHPNCRCSLGIGSGTTDGE
jgi:SPP1 gp7 family putative phage head morphogenesis protein